MFAPAFPALGRTTVNGRQHLNGIPLEETELWQREGIAGGASLLDMMSRADLESKLLSIETIRGDADSIRAAMTDAAEQADVLICDAETEEDLAALAQASLEIAVDPVWAGSAGLMGHLLDAADVSRQKPTLPQPVLSAGPLLFVVGSLSSVSRRQAERLAKEDVVVLAIEAAMLNNSVRPAALADPSSCSLGRRQRCPPPVDASDRVVAPRRRRAFARRWAIWLHLTPGASADSSRPVEKPPAPS